MKKQTIKQLQERIDELERLVRELQARPVYVPVFPPSTPHPDTVPYNPNPYTGPYIWPTTNPGWTATPNWLVPNTGTMTLSSQQRGQNT